MWLDSFNNLKLFLIPVWKGRKDLLYIGSFHDRALHEMYGTIGDHIGVDALGMHSLSYCIQPLMVIEQINFFDRQDPNHA